MKSVLSALAGAHPAILTPPRQQTVAMMALLLLGTLGLLGTATASAPCATDEDCSLNGVCTAGVCVCDPGWQSDAHTGKGTHAGGCGLLDFKKAPSSVSFHGLDDKKSSWGGSILKLPTSGGKSQYAMFAAEMTHDCTLRHWTTNSEACPSTGTPPLLVIYRSILTDRLRLQVVLAVSDDPTGP